MASLYFEQAQLMINVLTSIPLDGFALKGGTAINFFYENMPRYSVDIDLTFTKVSSRAEAIAEIHQAMHQIKHTLDKLNYNSLLINADDNNPAIKLNIFTENASVIIEPNTTLRGTLLPIENRSLVDQVVNTFKVSAAVPCLAYQEVYAGKLNAMLDRQHPRDIFDMHKYWQKNQSIKDLLDCFIAYVAQSNRPFSELLDSNELDITKVYETDFAGMTVEKISIDALINTRKTLFSEIKKSMTDSHKDFLLSMMRGTPDWSLMPFSDLKDMPAIQWKLHNIEKMPAVKNTAEIKKLKKIFDYR